MLRYYIVRETEDIALFIALAGVLRNLRQIVHHLTNGMTVAQFPIERDQY